MTMKLLDDGRTSPLQEVWRILLRRKWLIAATFLLIVGIVTISTLRTPKTYESRMKILVKNQRAGIVVSASSSEQSLSQGEVSETEINTEIELLNNNDLLREVVLASGLEKLEYPPGQQLNEDKRDVALENAVSTLQHSLKISPVHKADIIEVQYTAQDPRRAAAVLRQLASLYLEAHLKLHGTPGTHEFFLNQTAHYRKALKDIGDKLREFSFKNDIVMFAPQQESVLRRAADSSSMLLASDALIRENIQKISDAREQLSKTQPRVITQSRTSLNQASVERLGTMLLELQNRRTQLLSKFRPEDRTVQEVSQEIADTQAALDKAKTPAGSEQTTDVNPIRQALELELAKEQAELAGLQARRQTLFQQTADYNAQLQRLARSTEEYNDLVRGQKEAEENYLLYTRKSEEARIAESLDQQKIANVAIAETPVEPHRPAKPNVPLNLEMGVVAGGILSLGVAFLMEYLGQPFPRMETDARDELGPATREQPLFETVERADHLEVLTGLPVLATPKRKSV